MSDTLAMAWRRAIADPRVAGAIEAIYADVAETVDRHGPVCRASGRCCRFEEFGHRLYVTGLEAAYLLKDNPPPELAWAILDEALTRGGCPYQESNLCTVHGLRPLGCRVFYCQGGPWQEELTEHMLARLRQIHDRHDIPYRYGEWRHMLGLFV